MSTGYIGKAIRVPHIEWKDSGDYGRLLFAADETSHELCLILTWFREIGTKIEKINEEHGYRLVPVIDADHWSAAEWQQERQLLIKHKDVLVKILKEL